MIMKENKIKQPQQITIKRSEINFAHYNPRKISNEARMQLKANLKRIGLLGGIVWNKTTGNLVSGHQRVSVMDDVNKYEDGHNDYEIRVEVVELDEKTEKEQNIFMNNRSVQGEFDTDMLETMLSDIDFSNAGLDEFDLQMLGVGDIEETDISDLSWDESETAESNNLQNLAFTSKDGEEDKKIDRSVNFYEDTPENQIKRHNEIRKIKDRIENQKSSDGGALSYVVLSFPTPEARIRFMAGLGYTEEDKYVDGEEFAHKIEFGE